MRFVESLSSLYSILAPLMNKFMIPSWEREHLWHSGFLPCHRSSCANRNDFMTLSSSICGGGSVFTSDLDIGFIASSSMEETPTTSRLSALTSNAMLGLASSILINAASSSVGRRGENHLGNGVAIALYILHHI